MTYPMEIFVNGELSFKLDTEDAEGDLLAIKALMTMRTAKRQNRPLTNFELYGADVGIGDAVHTDAHGNSVTVRNGKAMMVVSSNPETSIPVGAAVLVRRGGHVDPPGLTTPSKGCYRDVKATYLGPDVSQRFGLRCRLEQDDPYDLVGWSKKGDEGHWSASCVRLDPDAQVSGCTFKKGDKDPCPTCPKLITYLHSCGLLQDELATLHNKTKPTT